MSRWIAASLAVLSMGVGAAGTGPADEGGQAVDGLRLVLTLDQTKLTEGQPWTGKVTAANVGASAFLIDTRTGGDIRLARADGGKPKLVMSLGMGGRITGREGDAFRKVEPEESCELARFAASPQPDHQLACVIGGRHLAWDLAAGTYELSVTYAKTPHEANRQKADGAWTGRATSNVVTVTVAERKVAAKPLNGLQLILDVRTTPAGKAGEQTNGRARVKNVSDKPIRVDITGETRIAVQKADGTPVTGTVLPIPLTTGGKGVVEVQPGEWVDVAKFFLLKGAVMVQANPTCVYGLPIGQYRLRASYGRSQGQADPKGGAWTGKLESNEEPLTVKTSNAGGGGPVLRL